MFRLSYLRAAITAAGGTPTQVSEVGLLRQLVATYGGTPTKWEPLALLRQAIVASGGTPTQVSPNGLMRELVAARGLSSGLASANSLMQFLGQQGGTPTPTPAPTPAAGFVAIGDSITDRSGAGTEGSWMRQFAAANPSVTYTFVTQGGRILGAPANLNDGGNSVWGHMSEVLAACGPTKPVVMFIGANGIPTGNASAYLEALLAVADYIKAQKPGTPVLIGTLLPQGAPYVTATTRDAINTERNGTINPGLRAAVGGRINGILPFGDDPVLGADLAGSDTNLYEDGLHPATAGRTIMYEIGTAVLLPLIQAATGTTPAAFSFPAVTNAALSTPYTASTRVTGLGLGQQTSFGRDAGTIAVNRGASGTSAVSAMNGDKVSPTLTSSSAYSTPVSATITAGSRSATFSITTAANVTPVSYTAVAGDEANLGFISDTATFAARTLPVGRFFFSLYSGNAALQPDIVKVTRSGTDYPATKLDFTAEDSWWYVDIPVAGSYVPSAKRSGGVMNFVAYVGIVATNCTTHGSGQKLAAGAYNNPVNFGASQPVNANELGIIMATTQSTVTYRNGATQRVSFAITDPNRPGTMSIATLPSTAIPSFDTNGSVTVSGGYALTARP